jgi:hypothetical protein
VRFGSRALAGIRLQPTRLLWHHAAVERAPSGNVSRTEPPEWHFANMNGLTTSVSTSRGCLDVMEAGDHHGRIGKHSRTRRMRTGTPLVRAQFATVLSDQTTTKREQVADALEERSPKATAGGRRDISCEASAKDGFSATF